MPLRTSPGPLISSYDVAMLDLDGVVYRGELAVPHAVEMGLYVVSTGASRTVSLRCQPDLQYVLPM